MTLKNYYLELKNSKNAIKRQVGNTILTLVTLKKNNGYKSMLWVGNRGFNPYKTWYYYNSNAKETHTCMAEYILKIENKLKAEHAKKQFENDLIKNHIKNDLKIKIGDIFHGSYGYNMTINEFFQVIEIKNSMVILKQIDHAWIDGAIGMHGHVQPLKNHFLPKSAIKKQLKVNLYYNNEGMPLFNYYINYSKYMTLYPCGADDTFFENHMD